MCRRLTLSPPRDHNSGNIAPKLGHRGLRIKWDKLLLIIPKCGMPAFKAGVGFNHRS